MPLNSDRFIRRVFSSCLLSVAIAAVGCSADSDQPPAATPLLCQPGSFATCNCPDQRMSSAQCLSNGMGFADCACGAGPSAGASGGAAGLGVAGSAGRVDIGAAGRPSGVAGASGMAAAGSGGSLSGMGGAAGAAGALTAGVGGASGMGAAGSAGAGLPAAGSGAPSSGQRTKICDGGSWTGMAGDMAGTGRNYGSVHLTLNDGSNEIARLQTTLHTPAKPPPRGTLFLWPGLQPLRVGKNYQPIGNGVLQPVLTWGTSCAPGGLNNYESWWVSGMYVNVTTRESGYRGCRGGKVMAVEVGDPLDMDMVLERESWKQVVVNTKTQQTVDFTIDMKGQTQHWAIFDIEIPSTKPVSDVIFTQSVITFAKPLADPKACQPNVRGTNDWFTPPRVSADGRHCCIDKMILRAQGVMATSKNEP